MGVQSLAQAFVGIFNIRLAIKLFFVVLIPLNVQTLQLLEEFGILLIINFLRKSRILHLNLILYLGSDKRAISVVRKVKLIGLGSLIIIDSRFIESLG